VTGTEWALRSSGPAALEDLLRVDGQPWAPVGDLERLRRRKSLVVSEHVIQMKPRELSFRTMALVGVPHSDLSGAPFE
jgi:hypothetical protein